MISLATFQHKNSQKCMQKGRPGMTQSSLFNHSKGTLSDAGKYAFSS